MKKSAYKETGDIDMTVREGMVFSIEPRVFMKGELGCGLEQVILVTDSGSEVVTRKAPYEHGLLL